MYDSDKFQKYRTLPVGDDHISSPLYDNFSLRSPLQAPLRSNSSRDETSRLLRHPRLRYRFLAHVAPVNFAWVAPRLYFLSRVPSLDDALSLWDVPLSAPQDLRLACESTSSFVCSSARYARLRVYPLPPRPLHPPNRLLVDPGSHRASYMYKIWISMVFFFFSQTNRRSNRFSL